MSSWSSSPKHQEKCTGNKNIYNSHWNTKYTTLSVFYQSLYKYTNYCSFNFSSSMAEKEQKTQETLWCFWPLLEINESGSSCSQHVWMDETICSISDMQ